jgi:hypothetical protein
MAILQGSTSGNGSEVDATLKALRVTARPPEVINWNTIAGSSGALTIVAAGGAVFSFRNIGTTPIMVRRVALGFGVTTAFTTAQALAYSLFKATGFSVSDSGQTALYTAGQNKHRTGMANVTVAPDCRISATAALTNGTRSVETAALGVTVGAAKALGDVLSPQSLFQQDTSNMPLILVQNEGLVITNDITMGAAGIIRLQAAIEFAEIAAWPY